MALSLSLRQSTTQTRARAASYHVLVEAHGEDLRAPDGQAVGGFQVWRRVRALDEAQAQMLAQAQVASEWSSLTGGATQAMPQLSVGALSRLSWLGRIGARNTGFEFVPTLN
jgi:hypothetical protein